MVVLEEQRKGNDKNIKTVSSFTSEPERAWSFAVPVSTPSTGSFGIFRLV